MALRKRQGYRIVYSWALLNLSSAELYAAFLLLYKNRTVFVLPENLESNRNCLMIVSHRREEGKWEMALKYTPCLSPLSGKGGSLGVPMRFRLTAAQVADYMACLYICSLHGCIVNMFPTSSNIFISWQLSLTGPPLQILMSGWTYYLQFFQGKCNNHI